MNQKPISVVLIPGYMLDESLWNELIDEMPKEWNISRATLKQGQTIKEIAQNIVKNAPESFVLIGFSLGGYLSLIHI